MKVIELKQFRRGEEGRVILPYQSAAPCDCIFAMLPQADKRAFLDIDSSRGLTDVYLSGECVDTLSGTHRKLLPLGHPHKELGLRLIDKGTELRRVKVFTAGGDCYVQPYGVYAYATGIEDKQVSVEVSVDIANEGAAVSCELEVIIGNKRGKRVTSRKKKLNIKSGQKTYTLPLKIRSANFYSQADPYVYTVEAKLTGAAEDEAYATFAVRDDETQFSGACVSPDAGIFGGLSTPETEEYKLSALKGLGYDAVRFMSCPSEYALDAADKLGMRCIVDIFDNWSQPKGETLAHVHFKCERDEIIKSAVRTLRTHPSVVMYSIGNCVEESYGRANKNTVGEIAGLIKSEDRSRIVTAALGELTPKASELERLGVKAAQVREADGDAEVLKRLGREVDAFNILTEDFAINLDAVGLSDMSGDGTGSGKPVYFAATSPKFAYDLNAELKRCDDIMGDISSSGIDTVTSGSLTAGDLDSAYEPRTVGLYRQVVKGRGKSFIAASVDSYDPMLTERCWNFGEPGGRVRVNVFTSGDVVALYLNGRLAGRKLAGRVNDFIASFDITYEPGRLEAVCFTKGKETDRCVLETTGAPRAIKLGGTKSVNSGGIAFVEAGIYDKEGGIAPQPDCDITIEAEGGKVLALGSGRGASDSIDICRTYNGRALIAIRAENAEKITVKVTGEGLTAGRMTVKIKQ